MYGNDAPFWGIDAERWSSCSLEGEEVWMNKGKKRKKGWWKLPSVRQSLTLDGGLSYG
jgi:hypothetical protein